MHLSHIPQYTIQDRNVHISVLNGVLWDMEHVQCGICEVALLWQIFNWSLEQVSKKLEWKYENFSIKEMH